MNKLFSTILISFCLISSGFPSVVINELMTKNVTFQLNENYNFEGWIELYNNGAEDQDISKIFLSDDIQNLYKWQMPEDTALSDDDFKISAHGYKIIYMDKLDKAFHCIFKLDADGGTLYLSSETGELLDSVTYSNTFRNTSYGRESVSNKNWVLFSHPTPGYANDSQSIVTTQTDKPSFSLEAGFYQTEQTLQLSSSSTAEDVQIYYTTDGSEPRIIDSLRYTNPLKIDKSTVIRAIAYKEGEVPSDVTTQTYLFETRTINVPVISLSTDPQYLEDDTIGILVVGKNGAPVSSGCNSGLQKANYMQDWDRPCNFEYFDKTEKKQRINQEVKIGTFGACSRNNAVKSLKVNSNKIYGNNRIDYSIFQEKPNLRWKSIALRNSGNDFSYTMLRDGFIQTLASTYFDIDHQAYEPASIFINGSYYGMLNIRERSNDDFIYSNYGLDEDEIYIHEGRDIKDRNGNEDDYHIMYNYIVNNPNINSAEALDTIQSMLDMEELLNYLTVQLYICNRDWPSGNIKAWKKRKNGQWRWILYDVDFGYSLYENNINTNSFNYAVNNKVFEALLKNDEFNKRLMSKIVVHTATSFSYENQIHILDSIVNNASKEIQYSKAKGQAHSYTSSLSAIRNFAKSRSKSFMTITSEGLSKGDTCAFSISSDIDGAKYILNNCEKINCSNFKNYYFKDEPISVTAIAPRGYRFVRWEGSNFAPSFPKTTTWKCFHQRKEPSGQWKSIGYNDTDWETMTGSVGFGIASNIVEIKNPIDGGSENDYIRAIYFRHEFNVSNIDSIGNITFQFALNDGYVAYFNGKEVSRKNITDEVPTYESEVTSYYPSKKTFTVTIPKSDLNLGVNCFAIEVHNENQYNSNIFFEGLLSNDGRVLQNFTTQNDTFSCKNYYGGYLKAIFEENPTDTDPRLYLNEICAKNKTYIDEFREAEDWIEIYNDTDKPVNLAGYYLSDARKNLTKFQIANTAPSLTTVPAYGYIVFWADSEPEEGVLHTNFSLSNDKSQTVSLSQIIGNDTIVIDSIRYQTHEKGESFARFDYRGDDSDWELSYIPTYGQRNRNFHRVEVPTIFADESVAIVYPNPVKDQLNIAFSWEDVSTVIVSDFTGRKLIQQEVTNESSIDLSSLKTGLYIVTIRSSQNKFATKIIKQ